MAFLWKAMGNAFRKAAPFLAVAMIAMATASMAHAQAPTTTPVDESTETPQGSAYFRPPNIFSDMGTALDHDARYFIAGTSHVVGKTSRIVSLLQRVDTFNTRVGRSLETVLRFYQEYRRFMELVNQVKRMYSYMQNYFKNFQVTVNLYRLLPVIEIDDPMDNQDYFVVGFLPKHGADRWKNNARKFGDNRYLDQPFSVIQVNYPHNLADLAVDASVWGNLGAVMDVMEFQKRLMAGLYDGVISASNYLNGFSGAISNLESNLAGNAQQYLTPELISKEKVVLYDKAINGLTEYRGKLLNSMASGGSGFIDASPESMDRMIARIDAQLDQLTQERDYEKDGRGAKTAQASQQVWMERMNFVSQVLVKLEANERRIAIARMAEKYDKYEKFWKDPGMMNPTPEITGMPAVDNSLYVIWQALTVLSWGKIPPPTPVSGGPAAEAMATITKAQYRTYLSEELRGVRQLIGRAEQETASKAVQDVSMTGDIALAMAEARGKAGAARVEALEALVTQRSKLSPDMLALTQNGMLY